MSVTTETCAPNPMHVGSGDHLYPVRHTVITTFPISHSACNCTHSLRSQVQTCVRLFCSWSYLDFLVEKSPCWLFLQKSHDVFFTHACVVGLPVSESPVFPISYTYVNCSWFLMYDIGYLWLFYHIKVIEIHVSWWYRDLLTACVQNGLSVAPPR